MKRRLSIFVLAALFSLSCKAQQRSVKEGKVAIMASAGYAWRTAEIDGSITYPLRSHVEKLTSGFHFDISAYHRIAPNMGLGLNSIDILLLRKPVWAEYILAQRIELSS